MITYTYRPMYDNVSPITAKSCSWHDFYIVEIIKESAYCDMNVIPPL